MGAKTIHKEDNISADFDDTSVVFDSEKNIKLHNCGNFYVRMFNKSGQKKFTKVSALPHSGWSIPVTTKNTEFSLFDKNGVEKCIILFPWQRYIKNQKFDEDNQKNLFKVEWEGNLECKITFMKKSYVIWFYSAGFLILCIFLFLLALQ